MRCDRACVHSILVRVNYHLIWFVLISKSEASGDILFTFLFYFSLLSFTIYFNLLITHCM